MASTILGYGSLLPNTIIHVHSFHHLLFCFNWKGRGRQQGFHNSIWWILSSAEALQFLIICKPHLWIVIRIGFLGWGFQFLTTLVVHKNEKTKYHKIVVLAPQVIIFLICNGVVNTGWPGISFAPVGARRGRTFSKTLEKKGGRSKGSIGERGKWRAEWAR